MDDKIKQIKSENFFRTYSDEVLDQIIEQQEEFLYEWGIEKGRKKMPQVLIIFDDMLNTNAMSNSSSITKLIHIARHYKISVWISTQKYSGVPRVVRINSDVMTIWRPYNLSEMDHILDEHANKQNKKKMYKIMMEIFKEPYQFIQIDYGCYDLNKRYRHGFDKFINFFDTE